MTRDDLAVVSRMFACWAAEDLPGILDCVSPELEWVTAADGKLYSGHEGVREFYSTMRANGQRLEVPLQRTAEVRPGRILAVGRVRLVRPGHGLADSPGVWVFDIRDGKIAGIHSHASERDALEAIAAERRR
jgi:ketosteroid isomerase-like protein